MLRTRESRVIFARAKPNFVTLLVLQGHEHAVAAALRFPRFLLPALPFLTPPIAMGAGPEDDPPRAVFLAVDARFLPPTATRTEDFAARRLGAVLRVSLIMSSRDWSRFMAAMVGGFDREARSEDSRAEGRRGDGGDGRGRGSRA